MLCRNLLPVEKHIGIVLNQKSVFNENLQSSRRNMCCCCCCYRRHHDGGGRGSSDDDNIEIAFFSIFFQMCIFKVLP